MKSVLISIKPKWCMEIANGKKTIEVRTMKPNLQTPFKCYIYATKDRFWHLYQKPSCIKSADYPLLATQHHKYSLVPSGYINGTIIGEFICDEFIPFIRGYAPCEARLKSTCLTQDKLIEYANGKTIYGWHISDLKIYDSPIEFSEFSGVYSSATKCKDAYYQDYSYDGWFCANENVTEEDCPYCDCPSCGGEYDYYEDYAYCTGKGKKPITRPPQSWCYVEEM